MDDQVDAFFHIYEMALRKNMSTQLYDNPDTLQMYRKLRKEQKLSKDAAQRMVELVTGDKPNKMNGSSSLSAWNPPPENNGLPFYHHRRRF